MAERNYQFRQRLLQVHKPDRRDWEVAPEEEQILVDESWEILISKTAPRVMLTAARDMQDYLDVSMASASASGAVTMSQQQPKERTRFCWLQQRSWERIPSWTPKAATV